MKYPHIVVHNGKWYNAGEEVPENNNSGASFDYSKTTINRMSTSDLQAFAAEPGIDNAEELTGAELKKLLIEKLGLQELNHGRIHHIRASQNQT